MPTKGGFETRPYLGTIRVSLHAALSHSRRPPFRPSRGDRRSGSLQSALNTDPLKSHGLRDLGVAQCKGGSHAVIIGTASDLHSGRDIVVTEAGRRAYDRHP